MEHRAPSTAFESAWPEITGPARQRLQTYATMLRSLATRMGLSHLSDEEVIAQIGRSGGLGDHIAGMIGGPGPERQTLIDVGSGAGLPALPVAIRLSDLLGSGAPRIVMVEPKRRAVAFLEKVVRELGLDATVVPHRAEGAADRNWRSTGDFITAKALAEPSRALGLCAPLCKIGGVIMVTGKSRSPSLDEVVSMDDLQRLGVGRAALHFVEGPGGFGQTVYMFSKRADPGRPASGTGVSF